MPPPFSAFQMLETLNILEGYDLAGWGHNSVEYLHHLIEAIKLGSADRLAYAYAGEVPIKGLLSKAYAASQRLPLERWTFLTGPLDQIESTVLNGFKIAMGKKESSPGLFSIFHGERLVLVDQQGVIRGYYEANDDGLDAILRDARALVKAR